ncbi:DUF1758 domain-containing protein [Trichonephila clavata]|uniref:DUF1758 domain-containing protein n=1 Tax=Trichonephila clavata TaxID=2740835 RepID=A0A8X6FBY0_TRICU|nr:DUF1758 domain-containing protein [Trichonephila clavata]
MLKTLMCGAFQKCRILIDSASQGSFVRESCVNLLQLKRTSVNINVDGLSSRNVGRVSGLVQLEITSLFYKNTSITVDALILPKITCDLPQFQVDASALNTFKNVQLADINCLQPSSIDILLGADVFGEIMLNRHLNVPGHSLTAMETIFGWVVLGKTKISCQRIISNHASYNAVEFQLDKCWQLEELSETKPFTNEEIACENHFKRTYTRDSTAALKDFYVDDLMSGANSLSEALELQNQLTQMVSSAGLVLRKWASNCSELLNSIDSDMRLSNTSLNIDNDDTVKTLGILWHPASDVFYFKISPLSFEGTLTKRTLLSTIAKTFDPLGWLSPITIQYKTIMQGLWKQQLKWDERVPTDIKLEWEQLANDVQFVKDIKIPRFLLVDSDNLFHLFGFSDASERAYAAAIYCRSVSDTGKINVQLIIAKTRVAPLKTVSLPRLELCGALLLVKLMDFTCKALNYPLSQAQFYTNSTIVLSWIGSHASRWKTFVANRVVKIQTLSSATQWHHISGSANPADLATRGVSSSTLLTSIWLCGPKFLHETFPFQTDSSVPTLNDAVPEERYCTLQSIIVPNHLPDGLREFFFDGRK